MNERQASQLKINDGVRWIPDEEIGVVVALFSNGNGVYIQWDEGGTTGIAFDDCSNLSLLWASH